MNDAIVIIPTYNEIENIEAIIRAVFSLEKAFDVLVVDDNSPDLTHLKVKELQKEFSNLHLEVRKEKAGLGTAYIDGFKWCLVMDLSGVYKRVMIIFLKWMQIFHIILAI